MTIRQRLLKIFYPALMKLGKNTVLTNTQNIPPSESFYKLSADINTGSRLNFEQLAGKKVMLVNTASDCGYTAQYEQLQKLHSLYKDELIIIGFPANDFNEQEKDSDAAIAQFCYINYGVKFLIARKSTVVKTPQQNKVFQWLSNAAKNGWNDKAPEWNFSKYLVNEEGVLTHYFGPGISPDSDVVLTAIAR